MAKRHRKFMIQTDVKHPETKEPILSEEEIVAVLQDKNLKRWAYVLHDSDETINEEGETSKRAAHWHICIWVNSATTHSAVAKWFDIPENFVEHEKTSWEAMVTYLTHELEPEKHRYDDSEIKVMSGYDWKTDRDMYLKRRAERISSDELDELYRKCANGTIREYDHHKHISPLVFIKNEIVFRKAFSYFLESVAWKMRKPKRIMFITGVTGSGKSRLSKRLAEEQGEMPFVTSSGNDAMDGYRGERIVIFDDFRGADWTVEQLLKLTDPYMESKTWSRFKSKSLAAAETIIFTFRSHKDMDKIDRLIHTPPELKEYFELFRNSASEPIGQWYRRVEVFTRVVRRELGENTESRTAYFYAKVNPGSEGKEGWRLKGVREDVYEPIAEALNTDEWLTGMGINTFETPDLPADWKSKVLAGAEDDDEDDDGLPF